MKKEHNDDELREISPFLLEQRQKSKDAFKMPDNYFQQLDAEVFERLSKTEGRQTEHPQAAAGWSVRIFRSRTIMAVAAAIAVLVAAFQVLKPTTLPVQEQLPLAAYEMPELSGEDIEAWVLQNATEFETDQLATIAAVEPEPDGQILNPKQSDKQLDIQPEDVESLLHEMSDEELEELL